MVDLSNVIVDAEAQAIETMQTLIVEDDAHPDPEHPAISWLARLRLLNGIPFTYLIQDEGLLPLESIRFFYIDRNWTDAAVDGALSVGTITTRDRSQLQTVHAALRTRVDEAERHVFANKLGKLPPVQVDKRAEVLTGFLLRSRAASGWPGIHVQAWRDTRRETPIGLIRLERLAPAVLLALFDGIPQLVTLTEPRQGVQFGVEEPNDAPSRRTIQPRNADGTDDESRAPITVPFRAGSPGVIHWKELANRIVPDDEDDGETQEASSAEVGLHMLRFPWEQTFGEEDSADHPTFVASIPFSELRATFEENLA